MDALYFKKDAIDMIDFPEQVVKEFQDGKYSLLPASFGW